MKKTLYYGGHIHTMKAEDEVFSVMGVLGEKISFLGNAMPQDEAAYDEKVDLEGCHVFPTLTDSHLHLLYSVVLAASDFTICSITPEGVKPDCLDGIRERIARHCENNPKQKIITANGFIISAIKEKRLPNRFELDEWSKGRAVIVYSIDGHSSAMSSKLMEMLGLDVKEGDGIFSGEAHEFMQGKVTNLIASSVTPSTIARGIANFSNTCAHYGISRVCAMDGNEDVKNDLLTKALSLLAAKMDIEVRLFPQYMDFSRLDFFKSKLRTLRAGGCGVWELDGSVGSHSAAFYEKYKDNGKDSHCYYEKEKVLSKVSEALEKDIRLSCHAIGEAAIDQITEIYDSLKEKLPKSGQMMRIDHFEFPSRKAVEIIKKLPLAITVQPGFSWIDKKYLKSYEQFLPDDIIKRQLPLKELSNAGVCICGSSDSPVQSVNPYEQMLGMTDFYLPEQSLNSFEALKTYTVNAAKMLGEDKEWGTLEKGKNADFFLCRKNILDCKDGEIASCTAEYMVTKGKRYKAKKGTLPELIIMLFKKSKKI